MTNFVRLMMAGLLTLLIGTSLSQAETVNYSPGMLPKLTKTGKPVLLDFYTTWCITCRAQQRVISKLLSNESEFSDVIWVKIDWDQYSGSDLSKKLRIPRRSVLVMLKNGKETSRLVAQTDTKAIRKLIQSGLN